MTVEESFAHHWRISCWSSRVFIPSKPPQSNMSGYPKAVEDPNRLSNLWLYECKMLARSTWTRKFLGYAVLGFRSQCFANHIEDYQTFPRPNPAQHFARCGTKADRAHLEFVPKAVPLLSDHVGVGYVNAELFCEIRIFIELWSDLGCMCTCIITCTYGRDSYGYQCEWLCGMCTHRRNNNCPINNKQILCVEVWLVVQSIARIWWTRFFEYVAIEWI